ncbi:hypothetical protein [Paraburkholderia rhynchosiae]|uniref:hypothetical protein n=1 Tax=Paraburkholderia rhynchosiae TaxID=487049 RepID=UPI00158434F2|nr:hypothetical protein [Paraburkholderia rhynchosiae]
MYRKTIAVRVFVLALLRLSEQAENPTAAAVVSLRFLCISHQMHFTDETGPHPPKDFKPAWHAGIFAGFAAELSRPLKIHSATPAGNRSGNSAPGPLDHLGALLDQPLDQRFGAGAIRAFERHGVEVAQQARREKRRACCATTCPSLDAP